MIEPTKDTDSTEEQDAPPTPTRKAARRKVASKPKPDSRSGSVASKSVPPPAPKKKGRRTKAKPAMVRLHNQLGQLLEVSVVNDDGLHEQVRLGAYAHSEPMMETQLTDYTRRLISRGYLRVASSTT
jgi:hypothetical protein